MSTRPAAPLRRKGADAAVASAVVPVVLPIEGPLVAALNGFKLDPARSYTSQVHDLLLESIVRGALPPRTALSEATISKLIDVSRTPVREALAQLAEEQMVLIYRQVGTIVAPVRTQLLEEGRFVRSTLECASHVQLVQTITPAQLTEFGQIVQRQRDAVASGQIDQFSELDELMHRRLFEFAGREHLWSMLEPIKRQFDRVRWLLARPCRRPRRTRAERARADAGADGGARRGRPRRQRRIAHQSHHRASRGAS